MSYYDKGTYNLSTVKVYIIVYILQSIYQDITFPIDMIRSLYQTCKIDVYSNLF